MKTLILLHGGHLGFHAGLRPLLLSSQRIGWSGAASDPPGRLLPCGLWNWTLQEMVDKPPALCPGHGCPPLRLAGWTCPVDSPRACLTLMGSVTAELSPTPASLTDLIQNSYSFPVLSPGIVNLGEKCAAFRDGQTFGDIPEISRTTLWGISGPQGGRIGGPQFSPKDCVPAPKVMPASWRVRALRF